MTKRASVWIVVGLTVAGALLRLPGLNSGLWFDEIVTVVESLRLPLRELVTAYPGNNNHPLYSLLAHLAVDAFGEHAWTARLPAIVFGVAGIPMLYYLAVQVTTRAEALLATLLLAVSYHDVWFSQNARGYTALFFFTLLATLLMIRLLERPARGLALAYGATVALGTYTHLTMAFVAVAHAVVWAWQLIDEGSVAERRSRLQTALLAMGVAGGSTILLYLPMFGQTYAFFTSHHQATAAVATPKWAALEVFRGLQLGFGTLGVLVALALAALGGLSYLRRNPVATALFVLPGMITPIAMLAMRAPIRPRFFFSFLGFGLLMLVRGAMEGGRVFQARTGFAVRRPTVAGISLVCAVAVASLWSLPYNYTYPKQDFDGALQFVESHRAPSEPVGTAGLATYPYERFYNRSWTAIEHPEQLEALRASSRRGWILYSFPEYMDPGLVEDLGQRCRRKETFHGTLGGGDVVVCLIVKGT